MVEMMPKIQWSRWSYAFMVACLFLLVRGYSFNTGDQSEHLPQVYHALDSTLYPNDYFVPEACSQFTVRYFYVKLALALAKTIGLEWGAFLMTLLCITVMTWSFSRIAGLIFQDKWAEWLSPWFVLIVFYGFTVGGNHVMYNSLISSTLGKALASVALLQALQRRWFVTGILLGLASLFQVLVGLQLMLVMTIVAAVIANEKRILAVLSVWSGYLPIALLVIVPTMMQQFGDDGDYDKTLYYEVLYRFRNYHHYLPSLFPWTHYVKFFGLLSLGSLGYLFTRPADRGLYPALTACVLIGMGIYTIGLELAGFSSLGKLQWFKSSVWVAGLSAVMLAGLVGAVIQSIIPSRPVRKVMPLFSVFVTSILLVALMNSAWLPAPMNSRYMIGNRQMTDLERMHVYIREHTPKDAMVLVSPDNNGFSCQAQRPMPVHFHAIIHTPQFMLPWYEKIQDVYGVGLGDIGTENARQLATERYAQRNYTGNIHPIRYRLDNAETCSFLDELGTVRHREGKWILSEFLHQ
jgi:hypothetical protein